MINVSDNLLISQHKLCVIERSKMLQVKRDDQEFRAHLYPTQLANRVVRHRRRSSDEVCMIRELEERESNAFLLASSIVKVK